jgi:hypothetical protein
MSSKNRPIAPLLIFAAIICTCPIVGAQMLGQPWCQYRDTTLLDYKMVAGTQYTIVAGRVEWHNLSLDFTNIDAQTVIALYARLSGLEPVVDSHAKAIHTPISVQAYELTQGQQISLVERGLKEQAGIVITRLDDKRAAVTYDSALPIKKPKD